MELKIFGDHDDKTVQQMKNCMDVGPVAGAVLCADGHYGYAQPVGGVVAYEGAVSISGVGFDIGCGNMAVKLDLKWSDLAPHADLLAHSINRKISFGVGQKIKRSAGWNDHELFDDLELWKTADVEDLKDLARSQLGTVGAGNHYVDVFEDEQGLVWVGVHFGSRGLGHKSATKYLKAAGGRDGMDVPPAVVSDSSEIGVRYLAAMELAGRYAYAGREWVVGEVVKIVEKLANRGVAVVDVVHNHHNYAWKEKHDVGQGPAWFWVVRKGATPAFPGQRGFVGGSMGDDAVILEGVLGKESHDSLFSTVHGAGRVCGRMEAKGKRNKDGTWKREPRFTRKQMDDWLAEKNVVLVGGDVDESPMAYRRLKDVLEHHSSTVKINHTLKPRVVVMAGADTVDPYKD